MLTHGEVSLWRTRLHGRVTSYPLMLVLPARREGSDADPMSVVGQYTLDLWLAEADVCVS